MLTCGLLCLFVCDALFILRAGTVDARTAKQSIKALLSLRKIDLATGQVTTIQLKHVGYDPDPYSRDDDVDDMGDYFKAQAEAKLIRQGTVHDMVIDGEGDVLLSTNISFCGGSMFPNLLLGHLFTVRNTGLAPGQ